MVRRTREDAQRTKETILNVAKELFCRNGYDRTNLCDIATEAGVTRGAVYWHFTNKDTLFIELWKNLCKGEAFDDLIKKCKSKEGKAIDHLRDIIVSLVRVLSDEQSVSLFRLVYALIRGVQGSTRIRVMLEDFHNELNGVMLLCIKDAIAQNDLPKDVEPVVACNYLSATLNGYISLKVHKNNNDFSHYHEFIADLLISNLAKFTLDNIK